MISLHAVGVARLIFYPPDRSPLFEGVLITEDTDETFGVSGKLTKRENPKLVDITVTDGETGQMYIIRRVELKSSTHENGRKASHESTPPDQLTVVDTDVVPAALSMTPEYELKSDVIRFETEEILVGNRADKDIRMYLNPEWVGKHVKLHYGPMSVHFSTAITPPTSPIPTERHHHISICASGGMSMEEVAKDGQTMRMIEENEEKPMSDADINYLM